MLVSDIYQDARDVLGKCDEAKILDYLTQACNMLARKARWNFTTAWIDICVCNNCITLPRFVKTVLSVNTNGRSDYLRDEEWFSHINGLGVTDCVSQGYSEVAGTVCTIRDPSEPVYVVAQLESAADNNKVLRVFGFDVDGNKIYTPNPTTGVMEEGFACPTIYGYQIRADGVPAVKSIYRVEKAVFSGRVKLIAVNTADLSAHTLLGYYEPDEKYPTYKRLKTRSGTWVRVRYQKADTTLRSQNDWIDVVDKQSILLAVKAVKMRYDDNLPLAAQYENEATRLLTEEQKSLQTSSVNTPQVIDNSVWNSACQTDSMFYGGGGGWN